MTPADGPVLRAVDLGKTYRGRHRRGRGTQADVTAVDGVSLDLVRGRITAVVGESGSGKSTTARMLAGIERPTRGRIVYEGRELRGRMPADAVQMVFQDPFASLNPVHTVDHHVRRPLALHRGDVARSHREAAVAELLERVQLTPAGQIAARRPHELSGGQRQRVSIARALAVRPKVLLADEPVSMLDVSMRLGLLNLLRDLARGEQLAMLYITHDIATARYFADAVVVMYRGRLVEGGSPEAVTQHSAHPYTRRLIAAAPDPVRPTEPSSVALAEGERSGEQANEEVVVVGCPTPDVCPTASSLAGGVRGPMPTAAGTDPPTHWTRCSCAVSADPEIPTTGTGDHPDGPDHQRRRP